MEVEDADGTERVSDQPDAPQSSHDQTTEIYLVAPLLLSESRLSVP